HRSHARCCSSVLGAEIALDFQRDIASCPTLKTPLLARAGMVDGYEHVCRRCKARGRKGSHNAAYRRCAPTLRSVRYEALASRPPPPDAISLRHETATLLLRAGVDPHRVQRILRHTDIR